MLLYKSIDEQIYIDMYNDYSIVHTASFLLSPSTAALLLKKSAKHISAEWKKTKCLYIKPNVGKKTKQIRDCEQLEAWCSELFVVCE
jgi:hypothetical protein